MYHHYHYDVLVTKVWSPTLEETTNNVESLSSKVDTIVIQGLTRELDGSSAEELTELFFESVEKCLDKADKVIVSLIVNRDDDDSLVIPAKLAVVNANIKLNYVNNNNVLVCHHDNLNDRKYRRRDRLHLSEYGTSRYANNLKFKIAESLGITVKNKRWEDRRREENRFNYRSDDRSYNVQNYWNHESNLHGKLYGDRYS